MSEAEFSSYGEMYLAAYGGCVREIRRVGTLPITLLQTDQNSHETLDRGTSENVICLCLKADLYHADVDYGEGKKKMVGGPNSINLIPAHADGHWRAEGPHRLLALSIPKVAADELFRRDGVIDDPFSTFAGDEFVLPRVARLMTTFWREAQRPQTSTLLIDGLLQALLGQLISDVNATKRSLVREAGLSQSQLARVLELFESRLDNALKLDELSAEIQLSPFHFSRAFKAATGQSPHQYLIERRLARARDLLGHSKDDIADIAYACGFSSQAHLTSTFSKYLGITPGRYRKEQRG